MVKQRHFAAINRDISEIGFGAWQLGDTKSWQGTGEADGIALVREALDKGMNFFDTAYVYGGGASETLLGKALSGRRDKAVINTKFPLKSDGVYNDSSKIRTFLETSLRRLQTDYVDSYIIHSPDGEASHFEVLEKLKQEGKILAYGASVDKSGDMLKQINHYNIGVLEILFNIFAQETAAAFAAAKAKNIALVIKVPLDSGWLSGKYNAESRFDDVRRRWGEEVIRRRFELLEKIRYIQDDHTSMVQASLRFILSYPEVTTVIPGVKNSAQLKENISASDASMPPEQVEKLKALWQDEIAGQPLGW
jgi:aryl-alcohol dehydrogenase-like predicted oxidoreductase